MNCGMCGLRCGGSQPYCCPDPDTGTAACSPRLCAV
jgi:hypothetical protein